MGYVLSVAFFLLAILFYRQQKVIDKLKQAIIGLKVKLEFARNEINFARGKYAEMEKFAEEQINRAEAAEAKLKAMEEQK